MPQDKPALKIRTTPPRKLAKATEPRMDRVTIRKGINVLLTWEAAERIWRPKSRVWYLSYAIIILFFIFVAVRLQNYGMLVALVAFMMLWFLQGTMEPWVVKHMITDKGIYTHSTLIQWADMRCFWFARKQDQLLLYIDFPKEMREPRRTLLVPDKLDPEIFALLISHIHYGSEEEIEYNIFSKIIYGDYVRLSKYIPDFDSPLL